MTESSRSLADTVGELVNRLLAPTGLMVTRANPGQAESWRARIGGSYRSDRQVRRLAREAGLPVADYLERQWGSPGRARDVVARMEQAGALDLPVGTVLEIGPGAGGYVSAVLERVSPNRYEIYEIEPGRARWLSRTLGVLAQPTSGETLGATADASVGLVHAHGVFSSLKVVQCFAYFREIARVLAPGGHACFDIMDDACLGEEDVAAFLAGPLRYVQYMSTPLAAAFMRRHGLALVAELQLPLLIFGRSTYLVFRKDGSGRPEGSSATVRRGD